MGWEMVYAGEFFRVEDICLAIIKISETKII